MMEKINNSLIGHGFIPPIIEDSHFVLGAANALPFNVVRTSGDWRPYLPAGERQARLHFETYGCTIYNTLHPIQILERKLFGEDNNYAERAVYIGTNTRPPGNDPHTIAEWVRGDGLVPEAMLPFTDLLQDLTEYASPNPLTTPFVEEGLKWLTRKSFGHEWVFRGGDPKTKQAALKEALRTSPLGVSVVAWKQDENGLYVKDIGEQDNHWTCLIAYEGDNPIIFDSYEPYIKKLAPFYDFGFSKRYAITKVATIPIPEKKNFMQIILEAITNYFKEIFYAKTYSSYAFYHGGHIHIW